MNVKRTIAVAAAVVSLCLSFALGYSAGFSHGYLDATVESRNVIDDLNASLRTLDSPAKK